MSKEDSTKFENFILTSVNDFCSSGHIDLIIKKSVTGICFKIFLIQGIEQASKLFLNSIDYKQGKFWVFLQIDRNSCARTGSYWLHSELFCIISLI